MLLGDQVKLLCSEGSVKPIRILLRSKNLKRNILLLEPLPVTLEFFFLIPLGTVSYEEWSD